jgi:hypothetical protein
MPGGISANVGKTSPFTVNVIDAEVMPVPGTILPGMKVKEFNDALRPALVS